MRCHHEKTIIYIVLQYFLNLCRYRIGNTCTPVYLKDLGLKGSDLGILVAVFALSQMIISPFGGTMADKLGKN